VVSSLTDIFPTELEANSFLNASPVNSTYYHGENADFGGIRNRVLDLIGSLERIYQTNLDRYTDPPIGARLYVEDIDSLRKVRDVNPNRISKFLKDGCLDVTDAKLTTQLRGDDYLAFRRNNRLIHRTS
jgi:hypothetical protein